VVARHGLLPARLKLGVDVPLSPVRVERQAVVEQRETAL
jgi:hypothetical protein